MAYQDAIMRKAAKTADPRRDPPKQPQDNDTSTPAPPANSKEYNEAQQAQSIQSSQPDTILKYPLDEGYLAYLLFRAKKINPWDIDVQNAVKLLDTPAITAEKEKYKEVVAAKRSGREEAVEPQGGGGRGGGSYLRTGASSGTVQDSYAVGQGGEFSADAATGSEKASSQASRNAQKDAQNNAGKKNSLGITTEYVDDLPAIKLYMPQAINFNDQVQYSNQNLGASGAAALAGVNATGSIAAGAKAFFGDALGFLGDAFSGAIEDPGLRRLALNRAAQSLPTGSQINTAASIGFQVVVNPNTRVLFENVTIRDFSFQFDFYPVSFAEAQVVQKIIKFFRTELYPSTIGSEQGVPIGFNFPHVFEIKLRIGGRNAPMPQPELCYLRGVQSTYNPGSMSFFDDGSPTHTAMTLNFTEFRTLSKQDIKEGR